MSLRWPSLVLASAVVVLGVASSPHAHAQQSGIIVPPQKDGSGTTSVKPTKGDEGYGYEFSDDPLAAGGFGPNDATIRVRPGPVRTTLIRPRTSFVPEMLKSVENL